MMHFRCALLFLLLPTVVSGQWSRLGDAQLGFEVQLPQVAELNQGSPSSFSAQTRVQQWVVNTGDMRFLVRTEHPLPPDWKEEALIEARIKAKGTESGASLVSANTIAVSVGEARQVMLAAGDRNWKGRLFVHEGRLVEMWFETSRAQISHADGNRFLESFRWKRQIDTHLETLLSQAGLVYAIDEEGDYEILMQFEQEGRRQVCYISPFDDVPLGNIRLEIWAPILMQDGMLPAPLANRLLLENGSSSTGYFGTIEYDNGEILLVYSHIVSSEISAEQLYDFIIDVLVTSDNMEGELSEEDQF